MQHYEIFRKLPSEQVAYVESATSLEDAKKRWNELKYMFPGDYFIFDCENSVYIVPIGDREWRVPAEA